jgi:hypothetical protein
MPMQPASDPAPGDTESALPLHLFRVLEEEQGEANQAIVTRLLGL